MLTKEKLGHKSKPSKMADRASTSLLLFGAVIGAFVIFDLIPTSNTAAENVSPSKVSAKVMGPSLRFLYCYS